MADRKLIEQNLATSGSERLRRITGSSRSTGRSKRCSRMKSRTLRIEQVIAADQAQIFQKLAGEEADDGAIVAGPAPSSWIV